MSYCPIRNIQCREDCQLIDRQNGICMLTLLSADLICLINDVDNTLIEEIPDEDNDSE